MNISYLPHEILTRIFSYTNWTSNIALTCKLFNDIAMNNRAIKLETVRCVSYSYNSLRIIHVISINGKFIIIQKGNSNKYVLLIFDSNNILLQRYKIKNIIQIELIISNVIENTIIILIQYDHNSDDDLHILAKNFNNILLELIKKHFKGYNIRIICLSRLIFNLHNSMKKLSLYIHDNYLDTSLKRCTLDSNLYVDIHMHSIPMRITNKYIYFVCTYSIQVYNYINNTHEMLIKPNYLKELSFETIIDDNIYKKKSENDIIPVTIITIELLKILNLPPFVLNNITSMLNDNKLCLKKFILTERYLAINYCNIDIVEKGFIIIFNLSLCISSIISSKVCEACYSILANKYENYQKYECFEMWNIDNDNLYLSKHKNKHNIQSLYRIKLR